MPETFEIVDEQQGAVAVLRLRGYLDAHTAADFEGAIQQKLDAGCVRIAVDCAGLSYISSAGLGVFMSFIEELREKDGDIRIGGLLPKVRQVFDILGFTEIFRIFDTARDAVSSFDSQEASHAANV
jgi:anti-sigma B factor antagonist